MSRRFARAGPAGSHCPPGNVTPGLLSGRRHASTSLPAVAGTAAFASFDRNINGNQGRSNLVAASGGRQPGRSLECRRAAPQVALRPATRVPRRTSLQRPPSSVELPARAGSSRAGSCMAGSCRAASCETYLFCRVRSSGSRGATRAPCAPCHGDDPPLHHWPAGGRAQPVIQNKIKVTSLLYHHTPSHSNRLSY